MAAATSTASPLPPNGRVFDVLGQHQHGRHAADRRRAAARRTRCRRRDRPGCDPASRVSVSRSSTVTPVGERRATSPCGAEEAAEHLLHVAVGVDRDDGAVRRPQRRVHEVADAAELAAPGDGAAGGPGRGKLPDRGCRTRAPTTSARSCTSWRAFVTSERRARPAVTARGERRAPRARSPSSRRAGACAGAVGGRVTTRAPASATRGGTRRRARS